MLMKEQLHIIMIYCISANEGTVAHYYDTVSVLMEEQLHIIMIYCISANEGTVAHYYDILYQC